ncbi:hypothetical protein [Candidatus Protochlamydia phocaeensis]|uniref:hypothetical protein n=1 Tax=Candidatus Protochlamydia phocaeensis TaxID=1414722 RepID=UPI00083812DD|nr:hypothetical protein [Candidatus Protochlamydia phocaeensis]
MSTVHGSPYWSSYALGAEPFFKQVNNKEDKISVSGWQVSKRTQAMLTIQLFGEMAKKIIDGCAAIAKQTSQLAAEEKRGLLFSVNPAKETANVIEGFKEAAIKAKGLTQELPIDRCAGLIQDYISSRRGQGALMFFGEGATLNTNRFIFRYGIKARELNEWVKTMYLDSLPFVYHSLDITSLGEYSFDAEDLAFLKNPNSIQAIKAHEISCFAYALLKKREPSVIPSILAKEDAACTLKDILALGYRAVSHPDEGDLVLYFDDSTQIQHMGIYGEQGLVESKWGINNTEIYRHQVFDVPPNYGKQVIFMRKSSAGLVAGLDEENAKEEKVTSSKQTSSKQTSKQKNRQAAPKRN